jgi:uncharacterized OB-fold protein
MTNPENQAFFDAAREGRFMLGRCKSCNELHYYPRAVCPFCSGSTALVAAKGRGKIYSYSVMRRVEKPYAIAYVTLDEGVIVLTNLVDCDFDRLAIGKPVRVVFKDPIPMFTLA